MDNIRKIIRSRMQKLQSSDMSFRDIYEIMFTDSDLIMSEYTDGYRVKQKTYGEHAAEIEGTSATIAELYPDKGYIALAMENCPEWITLFWSILKSGHNVLLVNMRLPKDMIKRALVTVDAKCVIALDDIDLGIPCHIAGDVTSSKASASYNGDWGEEIALFTSGTTLHEKVCVYSGRQIAAQILNSGDIVKKNNEITRFHKGMLKQLAFLPFYHIYGLTACYMWFAFFGRTFVFLRDYGADTITKTVRKHGVTHIFAVPMLWHTVEKSILNTVASRDEKTRKKFEKGTVLSLKLQNIFPRLGQFIAQRLMSEVTDQVFGRSIKFCITGGSYIRPSALKLINSLGYPLYNGYGMTEVGITSVELRRRPKERMEGSIGRPFGSVDYSLTDEGELLIKGSSIFKGMYCDEEYIPFEDNWFATGDYAYQSKRNYFLRGRKSDCVISDDGENLNPDEAERMLSISYARRFCILGLDTDGTEQLCLVIEPEVSLTAAHCKKMLFSLYDQLKELPPAYKIKKIFFAESPISSEMDIKVSRAALRRKISNGSVMLTDAADYLKHASSLTVEEQSDELTEKVIEVFADILKKDTKEIGAGSHFIFDLGGNSMEYLTLISELEGRFSVRIKINEDEYCSTPAEFSKYISSLLGAESEAE